MSNHQENVERGASLLDEKLPGWADRIDLDSLDLKDGACCVLGQLYGSYGDGLETVGLSHGAESEAYGFYASEFGQSWKLNMAWDALIQARQTN